MARMVFALNPKPQIGVVQALVKYMTPERSMSPKYGIDPFRVV